MRRPTYSQPPVSLESRSARQAGERVPTPYLGILNFLAAGAPSPTAVAAQQVVTSAEPLVFDSVTVVD